MHYYATISRGFLFNLLNFTISSKIFPTYLKKLNQLIFKLLVCLIFFILYTYIFTQNKVKFIE